MDSTHPISREPSFNVVSEKSSDQCDPNSPVKSDGDCDRIEDARESSETECRGVEFPLSDAQPSPPPDGGFQAWLQCLMTHFVVFNCWGYILSFSVFQTHYASTLLSSVPASSISWIGSLQIALLFLVGALSGRALDAGHFRAVFLLGLALQLLGLLAASFAAASYPALLLTQGALQGVGSGCQFAPAMALLSTYFARRRSLAIGLAAAGASVGGVVYPLLVRQLLPRVGFAWTLRALALVMGAVGGVAAAFLKPRVMGRRRERAPLVEWAAFKERPYALFCTGCWLIFFSLFFAFYYISPFARTSAFFSSPQATSLLMATNAAGFLTRILPGFLADRYTGPLNTLVPATLLAALALFLWALVPGAPDPAAAPATWAWAVAYGAAAAILLGLFPAALAALAPDARSRGARMGMGFAVAGLASLVGPPVGGLLVRRGGGRNGFLYAQMWAGATMVAGGVVLAAARISLTGWVLRRKV